MVYKKKIAVSPFRHPFYADTWSSQGYTMRTLVERRLQRVSWAIRQKPQWWTKYTNPEITTKWRREIKEQDEAVTDKEVDYVLAELAYYDRARQQTPDGKFCAGPADEVYFGDHVVAADIKEQLRDAVHRLLEDVPESAKDWHPGSGEKVLDLVHPSLYPLMFGRTPILLSDNDSDTPGKRVLDRRPPADPVPEQQPNKVEEDTKNDKSIAESAVDTVKQTVTGDDSATTTAPAADTDASAESSGVGKTNNGVVEVLLHPDFDITPEGKVYKTEKAVKWNFKSPEIEILIPLDKTLDFIGVTPESKIHRCRTITYVDEFDKVDVQEWGKSPNFQWLPSVFDVSSDGKVQIMSYINNLHPVHQRELYPLIERVFEAALPSLTNTLSESLQERIRHPVEMYKLQYDPPHDEDDFGSDYDALDEWYEERRALMPPLEPFDLEKAWTERPKVDLRGRQLKVIVKLANIELTPDKPRYDGGTWHVEGTANEDIVATALYYYDSENITHSALDFRAAYDDPEYEQGDITGCREIFGLQDEDKMTMPVGSVETIEDRLLTFPNTYQHHVAPFELVDKTRPGHRKILCFFLVDPTNVTTITTARVPPQQSAWWRETLAGAGTRLPPELVQAVADAADWPLSLNAAKAVREELMKERAIPDRDPDDYDDRPFFRSFSLCEH